MNKEEKIIDLRKQIAAEIVLHLFNTEEIEQGQRVQKLFDEAIKLKDQQCKDKVKDKVKEVVRSIELSHQNKKNSALIDSCNQAVKNFEQLTKLK